MPFRNPSGGKSQQADHSIVGTAFGPLGAGWDLLSATRLNVLLVGNTAITTAFADAIRSQLLEPLTDVDCSGGPELGSIPSTGTLILRNIEKLGLSDQRRLDTLFERTPRPRVISTSRVPLLRMVDAGVFLDSLYYRLNTLCFEVRNDA